MNSVFTSETGKEKFIMEVQKFPCLYNPALDSYSNKMSRNLAWEMIAKNCGAPGKVTDCKTLWKRLKEKYKRQKEKSREIRSGAAASMERRWSLFHTINFIEPHIQPRQTSSNFDVEKPLLPRHFEEYDTETQEQVEEESTEVQIMVDECRESPLITLLPLDESIIDEPVAPGCEESDELVHQKPSTSKETVTKQKKNSRKRSLDDRTDRLIEAIKETQTPCEHTEDATDLFFKSLASDVKQLNFRKRMKLQADIMKLFCDTLDSEN